MNFFKVLTVFSLSCLLVMACSEKQPTTIGQADSGKKPAPITQVEQTETKASDQTVASTPTDPAEIDGTLMQTEKGLAVVTATEVYVVTGQDLSDMIGETVKVTGVVADIDGGQVINVMTVTPME